MKFILPLACVGAIAPVIYGSILTPEARRDYTRRLTEQPAIASRISIPDSLDSDEKEALEFLYAYISTPDALDYDTDFFLENIRMSLLARDEMPWGLNVPEREWRHFVLPIRVNNENLDHSRKVFYEELKNRVKGLSMEEAILEVNHWCHEKVSYQPSDARTSSPLATVCNALGRCGEESTFTVAALRSVGIPARQVYTPRWAHTDDNHAWVEAWADGKWHFLGACEPEAVLDLAWFNAPASRGMLMTTKVTGAYDGPEEQLSLTPITTVINVTENYAPVSSSTVVVTDADGKPVENADVRFSLYNYAEFYPLALKKSDRNGVASFTSGLGDLIVWANKGDRFNLAQLHAGDTLRITLDKGPDFTGSMDFDIVPPHGGAALPTPGPEAVRINESRKAYEDSIRLAYVNTFISPERASEICHELALDDVAAELLVKSRGNHAVIEEFLRETPPERRGQAVKLLGAVAEKDLHDVTRDVLQDNMAPCRMPGTSENVVKYVLNPRIENEMLRPFKQQIRKQLNPQLVNSYLADPGRIALDLRNGVIEDSLYNPGRFRQSATSTLTYKTADRMNIKLAFVSICRSIGIPARIDPVSHEVQYVDMEGDWHDVPFGESGAAEAESGKGYMKLADKSEGEGRKPKYYSQFTISRIRDGRPELMEFDDFESVESINRRREGLAEGQYMLVTGQRLADGSVLSRADFFRVDAGKEAEVALTVRQDTATLQVIGSLDAELLYTPVTFGEGGMQTAPQKSILATTGRGYYVLGLIMSGHEPSAHALNDISVAADELSDTGRTILLLFPDEETARRFRAEDYGSLPANAVFGIDSGNIGAAISEGLELPALKPSDMPMFIIADTFNRIVYARSGYSIHLGETLAKILERVVEIQD